MNEKEFKALYTDTHTELQLTEALTSGSFNKGSVIQTSPGDKNIRKYGKIPGKNIIEHAALVDRAERLQHMLLDAISVNAKDILEVPVERLINLAIKSLPQKVDGNVDHTFTFADMVKKASVEVETYQDIDSESK